MCIKCISDLLGIPVEHLKHVWYFQMFKLCLKISDVSEECWNSSWAFKICLILSMFRMLDFSWKHFQQFLSTILMSTEKMMSSLLCVRMRAVWTWHYTLSRWLFMILTNPAYSIECATSTWWQLIPERGTNAIWEIRTSAEPRWVNHE